MPIARWIRPSRTAANVYTGHIFTNGNGSHATASNNAKVVAGQATPAEPEQLTDLGNGQRFARLHGHDVRHVQASGRLVWNGRCWDSDKTGQVARLAKRTALGCLWRRGQRPGASQDRDACPARGRTGGTAPKRRKNWAQKSITYRQPQKPFDRGRKKASHAPGWTLWSPSPQSELPIPVKNDEFDNQPWLLNATKRHG